MLISIAMLLGTLVGCDSDPGASRVEHLPFYEERTFTPRWLEPDAVPEDFHRVSAFSLTNQRGESITEAVMDDRITVVNYFFATCSGICPKLSASMKSIDEAFGSDAPLVLLSHSVTPTLDTVEVLADFAEKKGVDSDRWHLLTGDRDLIYHLGRSVYFVEEDLGKEKSVEDFLHTESIVLLDEEQRIRGVYNGLNATSVKQLTVDIATLMAAIPGS
ncbi:MAG: protein SCO1/2 [Myxococcota bacterium]